MLYKRQEEFCKVQTKKKGVQKVKNRIILVVVSILVLAVSASTAYASWRLIPYYYSDKVPREISYTPERKFYREHLGGSTYNYTSFRNHAINQWDSNGIRLNYFTSIKSSANILFYTGHIDVIKLRQNAFLIPGTMGFTERISISFRENVIWNGHIIKIYQTHRVEVWCPQWSQATEDKFSGLFSASLTEAYRANFTHELGHALGWMGHNPSDNHVMKKELTTCGFSGNRDTLSSQDVNHILQIYQIYQ